MSVKKQIPDLCKLYSFYEEIPEAFLDETDVDSYFYHNIFDTSQSQHRILRVSRSSRVVSRAEGGGGRSLCIKIGYSEPTRAESREGTSTRAESSRVT